jgi:hypothetical protein
MLAMNQLSIIWMTSCWVDPSRDTATTVAGADALALSKCRIVIAGGS